MNDKEDRDRREQEMLRQIEEELLRLDPEAKQRKLTAEDIKNLANDPVEQARNAGWL